MDRKLENRTMNVAMMMWYFQFIALFLVIHVAAIAKLEMCYFIIYACQKSYGNTYQKKKNSKDKSSVPTSWRQCTIMEPV